MRQLMVRSREDLYYIVSMDVLQIVLVVFMAGALGAVIVGVIAMAINGKLKNYTLHGTLRFLKKMCLPINVIIPER